MVNTADPPPRHLRRPLRQTPDATLTRLIQDGDKWSIWSNHRHLEHAQNGGDDSGLQETALAFLTIHTSTMGLIWLPGWAICQHLKLEAIIKKKKKPRRRCTFQVQPATGAVLHTSLCIHTSIIALFWQAPKRTVTVAVCPPSCTSQETQHGALPPRSQLIWSPLARAPRDYTIHTTAFPHTHPNVIHSSMWMFHYSFWTMTSNYYPVIHFTRVDPYCSCHLLYKR